MYSCTANLPYIERLRMNIFCAFLRASDTVSELDAYGQLNGAGQTLIG